MFSMRSTRVVLPLFVVLTLTLASPSRADEPVSFGRDVLPILSANCFACHGPDAAQRQADLRLDVEDNAKAEHDGGLPIVAGNPEQSTMLARLTSTDPDIVMPPPDSHRTVTPD